MCNFTWSGLEDVGELLEELALALGADHALHRLTVLEDDERGDAHDVEPPGDVRVVVDVQLGDLELAGLLVGDLVEDRGDHLARTAPLGPEVDEHRLARAGDLLVEGGIGEGGGHGDLLGAGRPADPAAVRTAPSTSTAGEAFPRPTEQMFECYPCWDS